MRLIAKNIVEGLGDTGLEKLISEVMNPAKSPVVTQEMANELAKRVVHETFETRHANKKLTGEWIVLPG